MRSFGMSNFNSPKITSITHTVQESWQKQEERMREIIERDVRSLSNYMGQEIWKLGYWPHKCDFVKEAANYDKCVRLGLKAKIHKYEETYAQRFYPLYNAYKEAVLELRKIKRSWWYKLLSLLSIIKE